ARRCRRVRDDRRAVRYRRFDQERLRPRALALVPHRSAHPRGPPPKCTDAAWAMKCARVDRMRSVRTAIVAALFTLLAFGAAQPAGAHGGSAEFKVLEASSREGRLVQIRVAVTFSSDREPAEAAL